MTARKHTAAHEAFPIYFALKNGTHVPSSNIVEHEVALDEQDARHEAARLRKNAKMRERYERQKDKLKAQARAYYYANKGQVLDRTKQNYRTKRAKHRAAQKAYYERNKQAILARMRATYWADHAMTLKVLAIKRAKRKEAANV